MKGQILAKGVKWSHSKLNKIPDNLSGVYIIFDDNNKKVIVKEHRDIKAGLREEFWRKSFWSFSWFATANEKDSSELASELKTLTFDQLAAFNV